MTITICAKDVARYFRYAKEPFVIDGQEGRVHLAYARCVACGTKRFTKMQLATLMANTNTYFCSGCFEKVREVLRRHVGGSGGEVTIQIFSSDWQANLLAKASKL